MREVAEQAQVSVTTVSHVINDTRPVSDELRARVTAAMDLLGYQPNQLARSLRRGETHTIGMIIPDGANPFFAEVARGIEDTGFEHGYSVILCNSDGNLEKELLYTNVLNEKQVDGIIYVAAGLSQEHILGLQQRGLPVVVVDREIPGLPVGTVITDNAQGGWLATGHLLSLGHRRIACLSGPHDLTPSAERVTGYRQALEAAMVFVDECLVLRGDFNFESGYKSMTELLALEEPPSAVFACNDLMAMGAMAAAAESGCRVPADLSVVGFDDIELASYSIPALTTVRQPKYEMGAIAARMLLEHMRQDDLTPQRQILATELVVRKSSAPVSQMEKSHV